MVSEYLPREIKANGGTEAEKSENVQRSILTITGEQSRCFPFKKGRNVGNYRPPIWPAHQPAVGGKKIFMCWSRRIQANDLTGSRVLFAAQVKSALLRPVLNQSHWKPPSEFSLLPLQKISFWYSWDGVNLLRSFFGGFRVLALLKSLPPSRNKLFSWLQESFAKPPWKQYHSF